MAPSTNSLENIHRCTPKCKHSTDSRDRFTRTLMARYLDSLKLPVSMLKVLYILPPYITIIPPPRTFPPTKRQLAAITEMYLPFLSTFARSGAGPVASPGFQLQQGTTPISSSVPFSQPKGDIVASHRSSFELGENYFSVDDDIAVHILDNNAHAQNGIVPEEYDEKSGALTTWPGLCKAIGSAADSVAGSISNKINDAMEGKDAPEMLSEVVDFIPSLTLPSPYNFAKAVNSVCGASVDMVRTHTRSRSASDPNKAMVVSRQSFAWEMGRKARTALQQQGIAPNWLMANRNGHEIDEALAELYDRVKSEYKYDSLINMSPLWVGVRERGVWRLVLDTGITEIMEDASEVAIHLETNFELPEQTDAVTVDDHTRTSYGVEGDEWEEVESLGSDAEEQNEQWCRNPA